MLLVQAYGAKNDFYALIAWPNALAVPLMLVPESVYTPLCVLEIFLVPMWLQGKSLVETFGVGMR